LGPSSITNFIVNNNVQLVRQLGLVHCLGLSVISLVIGFVFGSGSSTFVHVNGFLGSPVWAGSNNIGHCPGHWVQWAIVINWSGLQQYWVWSVWAGSLVRHWAGCPSVTPITIGLGQVNTPGLGLSLSVWGWVNWAGLVIGPSPFLQSGSSLSLGCPSRWLGSARLSVNLSTGSVWAGSLGQSAFNCLAGLSLGFLPACPHWAVRPPSAWVRQQ